MHRLQGAAASDARASERATCGRGYGTLVSRKVGKLIREPLRFYVIATLGNNSKVFIVELFRSTTRTVPFLFPFSRVDVVRTTMTPYIDYLPLTVLSRHG